MQTFDVLIVGGGAAGITTAAILRRRRPSLSIGLVEPSEVHYYQPAWTIVGGGVYPFEKTRRPTAGLIPSGVKWLKTAATAFEPQTNAVALADGSRVGYRMLIACPGIQNDWDKVQGLRDVLGRDGVCSNYSADTVQSTWRFVDGFKGGTALFTQPPVPFKCPGAPQKIAYLAADRWRRRGMKNCDMHFLTATPTMFGVPYFAKALDKVIASYGIVPHFQHNLVAVDAGKREATFEVTASDGQKSRMTMRYDLLHVSPPESPPAFVKQSPLANQAGYIDVDQNTMRSTKFENVYSLGDACSTPNSKTAAAVRKQAPILVDNMLAAMDGKEMPKRYDGYASCPLTTSLGTVMLAEFIYGGKVTPTFRLDPSKPRWIWWWLKTTGLPFLYWEIMLKGYDFIDIRHGEDKAAPFLQPA
ncbi:MAG TPA: FAD/NAD(P)-binding oxidoreductase [Burkholderiales bacterium]|nr:FAD/NAD(P)-binding oxidoreductase [Burkholderiales bacterium]